MKRVIVVRHAKSSWEGDLRDFDRPLSTRGLEDLKKMSAHFIEMGVMPDLIISSPANRALTTAKGFAESLVFDGNKFIQDENLYDFYGEELLKVINKTPPTINVLMLFGHNYAITNFVNKYGNLPIDNVPTCGLVMIDFDIPDWKELARGKTIATLFPKNL